MLSVRIYISKKIDITMSSKKPFRQFGIIDFPEAEEDSEDTDEVARVVKIFGENTSGTKINENIGIVSIYPDINPTHCLYGVKEEKHFWMLAQDCTRLHLKG